MKLFVIDKLEVKIRKYITKNLKNLKSLKDI